MPWCPKCKIEYVEGKTTCNDCGAELVDDLPEEPVSFMETKKEKYAEKFVQFLHYSNIDDATYEYDEEKQVWHVMVKEGTLKQVKKLYQAFYSVELSKQLSEDKTEDNHSELAGDVKEEAPGVTESDSTDYFDVAAEDDDNSMFSRKEIEDIIESSTSKPSVSSAYVKKEDKFRDYKSTAYTFLVVSLLGIAVLILNAVGVIQIFNGYLPYIVMGLLFLIFLGVGFQSLSSAKVAASQIEEENRTTEEITNWLSQNVTVDLLNSLTDEGDSEEIRFFHKLEKMKEMIVGQFGELDEAYLDQLAEEFYNNNLEQQNQ